MFDDDLITSSGAGSGLDSPVTLFLGPGDQLLDTSVDATGAIGTAVYVESNAGGTVIIRNLTAWARTDDETAIAVATGQCSATPLDVSIVNTIAWAAGLSLQGNARCSNGGAINVQVDHSDFNPQTSFGTNVTFTSTNNIDKAPLLVDAAVYAFAEDAGSPTIDAGVDSPHDGPFDPDGRPRFLGSEVDIGAYEFPAPYPVTGAATAIATNSATLNGTVDPEGSDLRSYYRFEYGTTTKYGSQEPLPDGTFPAASTPIPDPHAVTGSLTGLKPDTTYDYRLVADNADGETVGANHTFKTGSPAAPTAELTVAFAGNGTGTVNSTPDVGGCDITCHMTVQTGTSYTFTATADPGSKFAGWSGGGCSGTGACVLDLGANTNVTATFTETPGGGPGPTGHGTTTKPRIIHFTLTGLAVRKPKLAFTVVAGTKPLRTLVIGLPKDLRFGKLKHGLKIGAKATATLSTDG